MIKENKDKKVSVRISDNDYIYLQALAYMAGMTVSRYLRTLCDASINAMKLQESKGQINLEDIKALFND